MRRQGLPGNKTDKEMEVLSFMFFFLCRLEPENTYHAPIREIVPRGKLRQQVGRMARRVTGAVGSPEHSAQALEQGEGQLTCGAGAGQRSGGMGLWGWQAEPARLRGKGVLMGAGRRGGWHGGCGAPPRGRAGPGARVGGHGMRTGVRAGSLRGCGFVGRESAGRSAVCGADGPALMARTRPAVVVVAQTMAVGWPAACWPRARAAWGRDRHAGRAYVRTRCGPPHTRGAPWPEAVSGMRRAGEPSHHRARARLASHTSANVTCHVACHVTRHVVGRVTHSVTCFVPPRVGSAPPPIPPCPLLDDGVRGPTPPRRADAHQSARKGACSFALSHALYYLMVLKHITHSILTLCGAHSRRSSKAACGRVWGAAGCEPRVVFRTINSCKFKGYQGKEGEKDRGGRSGTRMMKKG